MWRHSRIRKRESLEKRILKKKRTKENLKEAINEKKGNNDANNSKIKKQKTENNIKKLEKNKYKIISLVSLDKMKGKITKGNNINRKWYLILYLN